MKDHKIIFLAITVIIYCLYSVYAWYTQYDEVVPETQNQTPEPEIPIQINNTKTIKKATKTKVIQLFYKNACSILEVFTKKPAKCMNKTEDMDTGSNSIAVIGITVFLVVLTFNAILDALKAKEEERVRQKANPNGVRRQSLAEFANKKSLRRESSKFGMQLCQILETPQKNEEEVKKTRKQSKVYTRGDSTNSYLSERKVENTMARSSESPTERKLVKQHSVAKLFGNRPAPLTRRSSFPALPLNPDLQALMLGHRRPSTDSDDESDGRGRRVRIIRRY